MLDVSNEEITDGSLARALALIATPIVVQQLVLVGQQIVDIFWVGRLGETAVAAVGLVLPLTAILHVGTYVAYMGGQVTVSQRVGADDEVGAQRAVVHAIVLTTAITIAVAAAVIATAPRLVGLLSPGEEVTSLAAAYLVVLAAGQLFPTLSDTMEAGFVGWGDSRTSMVVNVTAVLVNVVLDPFLIFGWWLFPELGVRGAALATVLAYAVGLALALSIAVGGYSPFTLTREALGFDADLLREVATVGIPRAGQQLARQGARIAMIALVSTAGGAAALAAYTVGARVATVAFVPAAALGSASTSVVGQNLGAAKPDRAIRATWLGVAAGATIIGAVGVVQWLVPQAIALAFVPEMSGRALAYTALYLQILAYGYWALGAVYTVEAGFNGASNTRVTMLSTLLQYWTVRIPVAALLGIALGYGAAGVFWAVTLSNVAAAVGLCGYFYYSTRSGMLDRAAERAGDAADPEGAAAD